MTNYNDGRWHGWNGGECPVHPDTVVIVKWSCNGVETDAYSARAFEPHWANRGICSFRVVKEYREPREFWAMEYTKGLWIPCIKDCHGAALFREVIE